MGREKNHLQVSEDKMEEISDISPPVISPPCPPSLHIIPPSEQRAGSSRHGNGESEVSETKYWFKTKT